MKAKILLAIALQCGLCVDVLANGVIIHASRRLRQSYAEPLPPKDFYVNLGARHGIRVGDRLPVLRRIGLRDSFSDGSIHLVSVPLGSFLVLSVGETASIGREELTPGTIPMPALQYTGFLVGDEVLAKTSLPSGESLP